MATAVGAVGLGASLAGGLLSAYGNQQQGAAQQQMYNYKAQVSKINADIDRQNAAWSRQKGDTEAGQYGMKAAQRAGNIRTAQAASGIDINSGSAKAVQDSQAKITATDLSMIRANAGKIAYDYETKAVMDENQAELDIMSGKNAKKSGDLAALGSIIGSVGSVSSKWMQGNQLGMWS